MAQPTLSVTIRITTTDRAYIAECEELGWMIGVLIDDEYGESWEPEETVNERD